MAHILDGKEVSAVLRTEIAQRAQALVQSCGVRPALAVILVGDNPASAVYVRNKKRACEQTGFLSYEITYPAGVEEETLLAKIEELNRDPAVHGILVQLPLPPHIHADKVTMCIAPEKDVDAFHPRNVGGILLGKYRFLPCTPAGVMELLRYYRIPIEGRECVVVGRSNIVGKPMALLLLEANGTVTVCHSRTRGLAEICRRADILVSAVGRAGFITADMVKPGAVVVDVGMNRNEEGKLCGDVDFAAVSERASYITPVPGGVGPMTITMLLRNTLVSAEQAARGKI